MRVITRSLNKARTYGISDNIARGDDDILIAAQRMIVESALPNRTPQSQANSCFEPPHRFPKATAILQLHQPMNMIRHHDKRQRFNYRNDRRLVHCLDHLTRRKKL